jgi:hypothetical protein
MAALQPPLAFAAVAPDRASVDVEQYVVLLDGKETASVGLTRSAALQAALSVVDALVDVWPGAVANSVQRIDILEQETREGRASWHRSGFGWRVRSVPAWLT